MSLDNLANPTVDEALKILKSYSCIEPKTADTEKEKEELKQALILISSLSEAQNFGVCADNAAKGFAALSSYLTALGYEVNFDRESISQSQEPIYIKFNTETMSHFSDAYEGTYRGVLVSCRSPNEAIAGTYGHLPLDLF
jgi:hypothetical protein